MRSTPRLSSLRGPVLTAAALLLLGVGACHRHNNSSTTLTNNTTSNTTTSFQSQFGAGFNTDFAANANSEPANVASGDVVAVDNTTEPKNLP